ncbi:MAG: hypothetical protein JRG99_10315 [Deltaproteobacteria bacterium]|nr:hypothetical protein [Deltaproteobacteria bacterium]MBW2197014.1 hypothetical protein [Deltaproteobacteria bacterium]MBW2227681.1 hypothetical protein [Deltaproteobacteria bacterium]
MDKIYFVEDNPPDRMNYANELSEFDHDVTSVSRSLLLELMDKNTVKGVEKRAHKRFQVNKDAVALIRPAAAEQLRVADKSMAEIACTVYRSKPIKFGRINNISMGGLSFRYITGEERSLQSLVLDILVADSGFYLENLTFKNIADFEMDDEFAINSFKMRLNRVQFDRPLPAQITKLRDFIHSYSITGMQR